MDLKGKKIGFVFTGSFCMFRKTIDEIIKIIKLGAEVIPIMSENSYSTNTKYGNAQDFVDEIEKITKKRVLHTIEETEKISKNELLDIVVVAPATGNTIAKLANDVTDSAAVVAVKSHLRREMPVVIAISTNDGLSSAGENIGKLLNMKHYYFVPFRQDNPFTKPRSVVFDPYFLIKTIELALENEQVQPILIW